MKRLEKRHNAINCNERIVMVVEAKDESYLGEGHSVKYTNNGVRIDIYTIITLNNKEYFKTG